MLLEREKNPSLKAAFDASDLNIPESSGLSWAARLKGIRPFPRTPGIDLMLQLCAEAERRTWSVYLFGAAPGTVEAARERILQRYPALKISGVMNGYFKPDDEARILRDIETLKPHLLFVGLGSPRQELWIAAHKQRFAGICAMGVGGSFDVLSGRLRRAPAIFQALGIEWLYRWVQEPWRAPRMLRLPYFLIKAVIHTDPPA